MTAAHQAPNARFDTWLRTGARAQLQDPLAAAELLAIAADRDGARVRRAGVVTTVPLDAGVTSDDVSPWSGLRALKFSDKSSMTVPGIGLTGGEPFSMTAWVYLPKIALHPGQTGGSQALVIASQMAAGDPEAKPAAPSVGWVVEIDEGVARLRLLDSAGKAIRALAPYNKPVKAGTWNHLTFTYDGSRTEDGYTFYLNGIRMPIERGSYGAQDSTVAPELKDSIANSAPITHRGGGERRKRARWLDWRVPRLRPRHQRRRGAPCRLVARDRRGFVERDRAADRGREGRAEALLPDGRRCGIQVAVCGVCARERGASRDRAALAHRDGDGRAHRLEGSGASLVSRDVRPAPRGARRANPVIPAADGAGTAAKPARPGAMDRRSRKPADRARHRQPVLAGDVRHRPRRTAGDFGVTGEPPSHPELLDWLAVEFRESGWDVKKLFKLMVTSATYRQAAAISPEKLGKDPQNLLLSRGPRFRMDGEVVRDYALAASGLLVTKLGGPSVKPYQPAGVWEAWRCGEQHAELQAGHGRDALSPQPLHASGSAARRRRRWRSSTRPTREVCTVRRERTNTPLQALVTLNDPQFVEAARELAQKALRCAAVRRRWRRSIS